MRSIFRYALPVNDQVHRLTLSGEIVHVSSRKPGVVEFWAFHGDGVPTERLFRIFGTGHRLPDTPVRHVGTVLDGDYVWHLLELPPHGGDVVERRHSERGEPPPGVITARSWFRDRTLVPDEMRRLMA